MKMKLKDNYFGAAKINQFLYYSQDVLLLLLNRYLTNFLMISKQIVTVF